MPLGELPLNVIVVIVIAAVVIISVFGLFGNFFSSGNRADSQRLFARGCNALQNTYGCDSARIIDITLDNTKFDSVCSQNGYTAEQCAKACGCLASNYQDYSV